MAPPTRHKLYSLGTFSREHLAWGHQAQLIQGCLRGWGFVCWLRCFDSSPAACGMHPALDPAGRSEELPLQNATSPRRPKWLNQGPLTNAYPDPPTVKLRTSNWLFRPHITFLNFHDCSVFGKLQANHIEYSSTSVCLYIPSWLNSDYASFTGLPQKWWCSLCILLEAPDFNLSHYWSQSLWCARLLHCQLKLFLFVIN